MVFCPTCVTGEGKFHYKVWMKLEKDSNGIPSLYRCPKCGHTRVLTLVQKVAEIIYGAKWSFGVPENCEVDEFYMDNEFENISKIIAVIKREVTPNE